MGSSQRSSSKGKHSQVKANWTPENHELFIDLCLEQISVGNRPGTHLNRGGWSNVLEAFSTITGLNYERSQLKNHWDATKKQWVVWYKLISTDLMKWDPDTRSFGASDQEWDEYLKENPEAAPYRIKELQFADKLDIVYGGNADSGETSGPTQTKNNNWSTEAEPTIPHRKIKNNATGMEEQSHSTKKRRYLLTNTNLPVCAIPERCYDAESRSVITVQSPTPKLSYSIEECIKCLDTVEELEQGSELYLFALDIFLKKEYREIFLNLKKSSTRIAWLERLQSVGPPLPLQ